RQRQDNRFWIGVGLVVAANDVHGVAGGTGRDGDGYRHVADACAVVVVPFHCRAAEVVINVQRRTSAAGAREGKGAISTVENSIGNGGNYGDSCRTGAGGAI